MAIINKDLTLDDVLIDYIDLGLKSGTLWAKCNLGANSPEEYGLYFQWGDVTGYKDASHSTWKTCPFNNGSEEYDKEYFENVKDKVCPKGVLASEYDAAYVATNGEAHIPTKEQLEELKELKHEWTELNGVNGLKIIGTNGNSIFIPAAGCALFGSVKRQGSDVNIWSPSIDSSSLSLAYRLYYDSYDLYYGVYSGGFRWRGFSVRAVKDK